MSRVPESPLAEIVIRFWRQTYYAQDANIFQAQVRQSPLPIQTGEFRIDIGQQLDDLRRALEYEIRASGFFAGSAAAAALGAEEIASRFFVLLPLSFQTELPYVVQAIAQEGKSLHLTLEADTNDPAVQLLGLPWELLFHKTALYAAHVPRLQIVRRVLGAASRSGPRLFTPLHLVHVIAEPLGFVVNPALQEVELASIQRALPTSNYVSISHPGSLERLCVAARRTRANVIHFLGHGQSPTTSGTRGQLVFAARDGAARPVSGEQLQHALGDIPEIQLIILSACETGSTGGAALDIARSGFPNIVAMQGPITEQAAAHFIPAFYAALQNGDPIAAAVAAGRSALSTQLSGSLDWCLPILYTNEGIAAREPLPRTANLIGGWLGHPTAPRRLALSNFGFGVVQLLVGLLTTLSGSQPPLPDRLVWTSLTIVLGICIVGMAVMVYVRRTDWLSNASPRLAELSFESLALFVRIWAASAIGVGLALTYTGFTAVLFAALGLWAVWSPLAQAVALTLCALPVLLLGFQQTLGHGLGFVNSARFARPTLDWRDALLVGAGYTLLALPASALWLASNWLMPPSGNFLIGLGCILIGFLLWSDATREVGTTRH